MSTCAWPFSGGAEAVEVVHVVAIPDARRGGSQRDERVCLRSADPVGRTSRRDAVGWAHAEALAVDAAHAAHDEREKQTQQDRTHQCRNGHHANQRAKGDAHVESVVFGLEVEIWGARIGRG
eukprot:6204672-Pleurochrysis_carterae.AAC.2